MLSAVFIHTLRAIRQSCITTWSVTAYYQQKLLTNAQRIISSRIFLRIFHHSTRCVCNSARRSMQVAAGFRDSVFRVCATHASNLDGLNQSCLPRRRISPRPRFFVSTVGPDDCESNLRPTRFPATCGAIEVTPGSALQPDRGRFREFLANSLV